MGMYFSQRTLADVISEKFQIVRFFQQIRRFGNFKNIHRLGKFIMFSPQKALLPKLKYSRAQNSFNWGTCLVWNSIDT